MKQRTLLPVAGFVLVAVVALLGQKAICQRWWIRDPERLARTALGTWGTPRSYESDHLFVRASRLRPDWYVPYIGVVRGSCREGAVDEALYWLNVHLPNPLAAPFESMREARARSVESRSNRAYEQALKLVADPDGLFDIWVKDPKTASCFEEGYRFWRARRFKDSVEQFDRGLSRCPDYSEGCAALVRASIRLGQTESAVRRLVYSQREMSSILEGIFEEDNSLMELLRTRRPPKWNLRFAEVPLPNGLMKRSASAGPDGILLQARRGVLWASRYYTRQEGRSWMYERGKWASFRWQGYTRSMGITEDGVPWVVLENQSDRSRDIRILSRGRLSPLFQGPAPQLHWLRPVAWKDGLWLIASEGLIHRTHGNWNYYPFPRVRIVRGTDRSPHAQPTGEERVKLPGWLRVRADTGFTLRKCMGVSWYGIDSRRRFWWGEHFFDGRRFVHASGGLLTWRRKCMADMSNHLWGPEDGVWGQCEKDTSQEPNSLEWRGCCIDLKGRLWFSISQGLCMLGEKQLLFWNKDDDLGGHRITSLALDGETLWIATDQGILQAQLPT